MWIPINGKTIEIRSAGWTLCRCDNCGNIQAMEVLETFQHDKLLLLKVATTMIRREKRCDFCGDRVKIRKDDSLPLSKQWTPLSPLKALAGELGLQNELSLRSEKVDQPAIRGLLGRLKWENAFFRVPVGNAGTITGLLAGACIGFYLIFIRPLGTMGEHLGDTPEGMDKGFSFVALFAVIGGALGFILRGRVLSERAIQLRLHDVCRRYAIPADALFEISREYSGHFSRVLQRFAGGN